MNKSTIIQKIIAALAAELDVYTRSASTAFAAATDEQSKAEGKYDTRAIEASYLARGQSLQVAEIKQAMQQYALFPHRPFTPGEPIGIGALVELERRGERTVYFIGPRAGGTEIECDGQIILVITPQSPLGQQIVGRKQGESLKIQVGKESDACRVAAVR